MKQAVEGREMESEGADLTYDLGMENVGSAMVAGFSKSEDYRWWLW